MGKESQCTGWGYSCAGYDGAHMKEPGHLRYPGSFAVYGIVREWWRYEGLGVLHIVEIAPELDNVSQCGTHEDDDQVFHTASL